MRVAFIIISLFIVQAFADHARTVVNDIPGFQLLPPTLTVYVSGSRISTQPSVGSFVARLPVNNDMKINPGCYIACYRHGSGVYPVGDGNYAVGLVHVWGNYQLRTKVCQPKKAKGHDISQLAEFTDYCTSKINACQDGQCWAGGDTGGWFTYHKIHRTIIKDGKIVSPIEPAKTNPTPALPTQTSLFDPTEDQTLESRRVP